MTFKEIETEYERLKANGKLLKLAADKISVCDVVVLDAVEKMRKLNIEARLELHRQFNRRFPTLLNELKKMGKDFDAWLLLLKKYPSFIRGNEQALICLFWVVCSTDSPEAGGFAKSLLQVVVRRRIILFSLKPENKSLFEALSVSIEKVASQKQKRAFACMAKSFKAV